MSQYAIDRYGNPVYQDPLGNNGDNFVFTDSLGQFLVHSLAAKQRFLFEKENYEPQLTEVQGYPEETVYLEIKLESEEAAVEGYERYSGDRYRLYKNYPNPFNAATNISFDIPVSAEIDLTVIDLLGRQVRWLSRGRLPAGSHRVVWDGTDDAGRGLPSGIYLIRLMGGDRIQTIKTVLQK